MPMTQMKRVKFKKKQLLFLMPLVLFFILCLFLMRGLSLHPTKLSSTLINKKIPEFSLPGLSSQDLLGHICLLNIWATWCINCQIEHPVLMDIHQKGILIYGIGYKDSEKKIQQWLKQYGNPYQKLGLDTTGNTAINLGVYGTPETFVIDQNGIVRDKIIGSVTEDVWENQIKPDIAKIKQTANDRYVFATRQQDEQFSQLTHKLRCLVCQNESLADSNAALAQDLKNQVAQMVRDHNTNPFIINYLVQRYGDFVLYQPPVKSSTYLLWFGPVILFIVGLLLVIFRKKL